MPVQAVVPQASTSSSRRLGPSASSSRTRAAAASMSIASTALPWTRSHHSRRSSRMPLAKSQYSRGETTWIVERISVACTTRRRSRARVSRSVEGSVTGARGGAGSAPRERSRGQPGPPGSSCRAAAFSRPSGGWREERGELRQADLVRDQPLPRIRAAHEEGERGTDVAGRVLEGAAQRELLVVEAVRVHRRASYPARVRRRTMTLAARPDEVESLVPGLLRAGGLHDEVGVAPVAGLAAELGQRAPGAPAGRRPRRPARPRRGCTAQSIRPIGPAPRTSTVSPSCRPSTLDAVQAARQRLDERRDAAGSRSGTRNRFTLGDPRRDEQVLGVGAVQQLEALAERLLRRACRQRSDRTAPSWRQRRVGRWTRRCRRTRVRTGSAASEQPWVPAPVRLQVGARPSSAVSTWTRTSPGPGSGRGTSSSRRSPGPWNRSAFTA